MASRMESSGKTGGDIPLRGQVFRREGEYWTLTYEGVTARLRDTRGMQHLACLLSRPYEQVAALELDSSEQSVGGEGAAERARVNVTRAIRLALERIAAHHPTLAWHLRNTIKTGKQPSYSPDPRVPTQWTI